MSDATTFEVFRDVLNALRPGWVTKGDAIVGPDGAAVRFTQRHEGHSEGHVDVQFVLDDAAPQKVELWDCVTGYGSTPADRARFAAHLWSQTTAGALLELKYSLQGEFADHYHADDDGALPGWHTIAGAVIGFGKGESASVLQRWWLDNSVLPALARPLEGSLSEPNAPHGIKIFFGGDGIGEVRVDGEEHDAASSVLKGLSWPRLNPPGFVRSYFVLLLILPRKNGDPPKLHGTTRIALG